jgi:hypothetical protein
LTVDNLAEQLQDQTPAAHRARAAARMPGSLFGSSTGGSAMSNVSPFGIITRIFSEINSRIATADPADIQGPADLPNLFVDFIESLPVVGQLVGLLEAILGNYDGDDEVLSAIQDIFKPLRTLVQLIAGQDVGWPTKDDVAYGWLHLHDAVDNKIQGIIDRIYNAFAHLGEMLDENNPLNRVIDAILGIFDTARYGSKKATELAARVRALESAANTITLAFNGPARTPLDTGLYDIRRMGGGAGDIGTDGKGNMVWKPFGAGNRTVLARYKVSGLTVDDGHIQAVLATNPQPYRFDDAYTYLLFRMNAAKDTMMRLRIGFDSMVLQAVVSDAVTNIGYPVNVDPKAGNDIDIWFGDPDISEPRRFRVELNGTEVIDEVDTAAVSQVGSGYRDVGVGMETGNYLILGQNRPAGLCVVTASEVG